MSTYCTIISDFLKLNWKDIIEVVFWFFTLIIAWTWLQTWKRQLKGTIEYELAKKILHRVYQVERYFNQVRNPFVSVWELYVEFSEEDRRIKSDSERKYEENYKAYKSRLDPLFLITEQLNVDILEAEVLWWNDLKKLVYEMFNHLRALQVWVEEYIKIQSGLPGYKEDYPKDLKKEYRDIIYWKQVWYFTEYHKDDIFALGFETKRKAIENYLKPFLKK